MASLLYSSYRGRIKTISRTYIFSFIKFLDLNGLYPLYILIQRKDIEDKNSSLKTIITSDVISLNYGQCTSRLVIKIRTLFKKSG
jgi:hypothetical protein